MRVQAIWNGQLLAESEDTIRLEGNHYFPVDAVNLDYFEESEQHTNCAWKGIASYYDIVVEDTVNRGAAWYYPDPSQMAQQIKDRIAFWRGVEVVEIPGSG